jgi:putative transposase
LNPPRLRSFLTAPTLPCRNAQRAPGWMRVLRVAGWVRSVATIYRCCLAKQYSQPKWVTPKLIDRYGTIAIENLNVKGMVQNHCLAKSISDASWGMFRSVLTQKAESATRQLVSVEPAYTSQDCSTCGYRVKKKLSERVHSCPNCGLVMDRDHNAALNIISLGLQRVGQSVEATAFMRVE